jgi:hypothetical protein
VTARSLAVLMVVACRERPPQAPAPRVKLTVEDWLARCRDRVELARIAVARLEPEIKNGAVELDGSSWNPAVDFEARIAGGVLTAGVAHGPKPCRDPSRPPRPARVVDWHDFAVQSPTDFQSAMRIGDDRAGLYVKLVSEDTAVAFRREMQFALRECVLDAAGVPIECSSEDN